MYGELIKAVVGLLIAALHIPIADFIAERDRELCSMFRRRGVNLPEGLTREQNRTLMFCMGIFVTLFQITHIWLTR